MVMAMRIFQMCVYSRLWHHYMVAWTLTFSRSSFVLVIEVFWGLQCVLSRGAGRGHIFIV